MLDKTSRVGVHDPLDAEAGADRARAVGIVEREHTRRQLLNGIFPVGAFALLGTLFHRRFSINAALIEDPSGKKQRIGVSNIIRG